MFRKDYRSEESRVQWHTKSPGEEVFYGCFTRNSVSVLFSLLQDQITRKARVKYFHRPGNSPGLSARQFVTTICSPLLNEAHLGCNSRHGAIVLATAISVSSTTFVVITDRASTRGGHFKIRFLNTGCSPSRGKASRGTFTFLTVAKERDGILPSGGNGL